MLNGMKQAERFTRGLSLFCLLLALNGLAAAGTEAALRDARHA